METKLQTNTFTVPNCNIFIQYSFVPFVIYFLLLKQNTFLHQIQGTASQWKKKKMAKQLKDSFTNQTLKEYRVYVSLPKEEDHACHLIGEVYYTILIFVYSLLHILCYTCCQHFVLYFKTLSPFVMELLLIVLKY